MSVTGAQLQVGVMGRRKGDEELYGCSHVREEKVGRKQVVGKWQNQCSLRNMMWWASQCPKRRFVHNTDDPKKKNV
jgi:hypothetical protein